MEIRFEDWVREMFPIGISENKIVELEQNYSRLHSNYNMALQTAEEHRKELVELRKVLQSC